MFCDLVGSTGLATRLDAEDWRMALFGYRRRRRTLVAAMLDDQRGDRHQMRDVGNRRPFAGVGPMKRVGIAKGFVELSRQRHRTSNRDL